MSTHATTTASALGAAKSALFDVLLTCKENRKENVIHGPIADVVLSVSRTACSDKSENQ